MAFLTHHHTRHTALLSTQDRLFSMVVRPINPMGPYILALLQGRFPFMVLDITHKRHTQRRLDRQVMFPVVPFSRSLGFHRTKLAQAVRQ